MSRLRLFTAIVTFAVFCSPALAQTWNTTTGSWNVGTNWSGGVVPTSGNNTSLVFNNSSAAGYTSTNNIAGTFNLNSITTSNTGTGNITIAGNALNFAGVSPLVNTNSGVVAFSGNIGSSGTLVKAGTGTMLVNGNANFTSASASALVVTDGRIGGTGTITAPTPGVLNAPSGPYALTVGTGASGALPLLSAGNGNGGTLTVSGGVALNNTAAPVGSVYRITNGSTPSNGTIGSSTLGTIPNPTSNNFVNITSGGLIFDPDNAQNIRVIIDGTGTTFAPNSTYSYTVARVIVFGSTAQDLSEANLAGPDVQGLFQAVGFTGQDFSLTGDINGFLYIGFTTPVPEPGSMLLIGAVGAGAMRFVRRRRVAKLA